MKTFFLKRDLFFNNVVVVLHASLVGLLEYSWCHLQKDVCRTHLIICVIYFPFRNHKLYSNYGIDTDM